MKKSVGRPSGYKKKYCKDIIALGEQGFLPVIWIKKLMIPKSTLHEWRNAHPEFSYAWDFAKDLAEAYITDSLIDSEGKFEFDKHKYLLSAAFQVSEVAKQEIKSDIKQEVTTIEVDFGSREA